MSGNVIHHGGRLDAAIARYGGSRAEWLDLSTGINPQPWPVTELSGESWARLPDSGAADRLVTAARNYYRVPADLEIVAAPGVQALIEMLPRMLPGRTATIIAPRAGTYGEHAHCCQKAGREVRMAGSPGEVADGEKLAVIVRPNNPDGSIAGREELLRLHEQLAGNDGWLIVDEAFCDTEPETSLIGERLERAVIFRSFGKFFGLAGVRLGFAACEAQLADEIRDWIGPWAVSGPALEIGAAAMADEEWIKATGQRLQADSERLTGLLKAAGFSVAGRNGLFVLGRIERADQWHDLLCERHILTRAFEHDPSLLRFGLPDGDAGFARLEQALAEIAVQGRT